MERDLAEQRRLRVTPGEDGQRLYEYTVNGRSMPVDDAVRAWFEDTLEQVAFDWDSIVPQAPREKVSHDR